MGIRFRYVISRAELFKTVAQTVSNARSQELCGTCKSNATRMKLIPRRNRFAGNPTETGSPVEACVVGRMPAILKPFKYTVNEELRTSRSGEWTSARLNFTEAGSTS